MLLACLALLSMPPSIQPAPDSCIVFISRNLAKGDNNFFTYYQFSGQRIKIKPGDMLSYQIYLDPKNPLAKGGIDIEFADGGTPLRDLHPKDQYSIDAHGDGLLDKAKGAWLERLIPLELAQGKIARSWNLVFEGDQPGRYVQFIDNVRVIHVDGTETAIYANGLPPVPALLSAEGYTKQPYCLIVERERVSVGAPLDPLIAELELSGARLAKLDETRTSIRLAKEFVSRNPDQQLMTHVKRAEGLLEAVESKLAPTAQEIELVLHEAKAALAHTHPVMEKYTGHLVGHAHIDLQWLWEWQEGIVATHDTFNQVVKFMSEFPGFTFSQSSSCLYQTTEEHYPALFKQVQAKVKSGQWEIVGGRVCEGDTNLISPESTARQFLYGQKYFQERFGKTAVVGWEPDTFGHNLQMPQILKLGGCKYYYFCRGGKGKPLFWWKGLDGTKILTFDEPASGSWYNSDLSYKQFQEMLDFQDNTGSKDSILVYGIGNHGGGPTREYINVAESWMKDPTKPKVKFSTATEFFKKLETYNLTKIPVVDQELNPVFDGCYTSHSEVKQLNRDAEAVTTSAEAIAAMASLQGFPYPSASFRRNWEDICINHHHDTLPGSGIHAPYENTKIMLNRVIADGKDIINRATQAMSLRVTPNKGGISVMVFNPTGWARNGWVETYLVQSGWYGGERLNPAKCAAYAPNGDMSQVDLLDGPSRLGRFFAVDVPAFGYKVFQIKTPKVPGEIGVVMQSKEGASLENGALRAEFDLENGLITRLQEKQVGKEFLGPLGRLENHFESPGGMSAWVIGAIKRKESWLPIKHELFQRGSTKGVTFYYSIKSANNNRPTTVSQTFSIDPWSKQVDVDVVCDWQHIGTGQTENPMLRVAFETDLKSPEAFYEIPFGTIKRPIDGKEMPALKWASLQSETGGLAILNDSKHGYSAEGTTMRLSLIRSSFDPDPVPNPGAHRWGYAIAPYWGSWETAGIARMAADFNQPLVGATVPFDAKGARPLSWGLCRFSGSMVPTCLKKADDDDDLIIRYYQNSGTFWEGALSWTDKIQSAQWVNFLEQVIGPARAYVPINRGQLVDSPMRPFEIRTLKVKLR